MNTRPAHPHKRPRLRPGLSQPGRSSFREGGRIVLAIILGMAVAHGLLTALGLTFIPDNFN